MKKIQQVIEKSRFSLPFFEKFSAHSVSRIACDEEIVRSIHNELSCVLNWRASAHLNSQTPLQQMYGLPTYHQWIEEGESKLFIKYCEKVIRYYEPRLQNSKVKLLGIDRVSGKVYIEISGKISLSEGLILQKFDIHISRP